MRQELERRMLLAHPDLPAGVVLAAVARAVRLLASRGVLRWPDAEAAATESLLLRDVQTRRDPRDWGRQPPA